MKVFRRRHLFNSHSHSAAPAAANIRTMTMLATMIAFLMEFCDMALSANSEGGAGGGSCGCGDCSALACDGKMKLRCDAFCALGGVRC